ncbi:type II toxin-antitoxin system VapC family toxin [Devosia honganensis]|uniref:Type II toxin-antitoxin system VapC family toxin n=1 Tax=Devosia honganensis TaxID=1610527 RepID=A0ABV7X473_9HYPH
MLDTNIVSVFMRYPAGRVGERLRVYEVGSVAISVIVLCELRFGIARTGSARLQRQMEWALGFLEVLPFESPADQGYADLRAALERDGKPIGSNDLFIAAHAVALNLPLVTANMGEFSRVAGLKLENWLD